MGDATVSLLLGLAVRSTILLLVALAAVRLLVRQSAAVRHGVLTAAVIGAIIVPGITLFAPGLHTPFAARALSAGLEWLRQPMRAFRGEADAVRPDPRSGIAVADQIDLDAPAQTPASRGVLVLTILWAAGALIVGTRTAVRARAAARLTKRARLVGDPSLLTIAREVAVRQGRSAPPPLFETPEVSAPATVGIVRPAVLLPATRSWTRDHTCHVLAHEIAHAARRDCLTQTLAHLACALHWFNPLMWIVERRMALERERACDDVALRGGAPAEGYAMLLIDVARRTRERALPPAAMLAMARPSELETRLLTILDPACDRRTLSRRARHALTVIATVTVALSGAVRLEAAPEMPNAPVVLPQVSGVVQASHVEPDTRKDSVADPSSERIAPASLEVARRRGRVALTGPDSGLARSLLLGLGREPRSREDLVRERAAWALSQAQGDRLVEPLIAALGHKDWRVRAYAAWSLTHAHDPRAVPPLIEQMTHPVWRLRAMAAHALADSDDPQARPAMTAAVTDEAWQVRMAAVRYLGRLDDADARARVRAALRDRHIAVRNSAEEALAP